MDDYEDRPIEYEPIVSIEQETVPENDDKWYGVPAPGENPVTGRYIVYIIVAGILSICLLAGYIKFSLDLFSQFSPVVTLLIYIFTIPIIFLLHLTPLTSPPAYKVKSLDNYS